MTAVNTMNETTTQNLKEVTFTVQDGDHTIDAKASTLTGKEYIYFNGKKIIENRNIGFSSKYAYETDGHTYEFRFILKLSSIEFLTIKEDVIIYSETISIKRQQKSGLFWGLLLGLPVGYFGYDIGIWIGSLF